MKRLLRSRKQKMIAGICGGIAEYLNIDVTWVRVGYVALALFTFFAPFFIFYIVLYFIIPESDEWEN